MLILILWEIDIFAHFIWDFLLIGQKREQPVQPCISTFQFSHSEMK